jgi:DNA repair protein RecN (Recombination protein N)
LARAEELLQAAGLAADLLSAESDGADVNGLVAQASAQLARVAGVDDRLDALAAELLEIQYRLTEVARDLHAHAGEMTVDPERLQAVDARLRVYTDLARKYGGSTESAQAYAAKAAERLSVLERTEDDLRGLTEARAARCALALDLSAQLSARRRQAAPLLEEAVGRQLADLGMPEAQFAVLLRERTGWEGLRESGAESTEFLLSANPGLPARALASTASGGELSRVLLALKSALAGAGGDETLVFDEIDAGIGGRTAVAVAAKLRELSGRSQTVVVTHLPSVAAVADRHYLIDKSLGNALESSSDLDTHVATTTTTRLSLLEDGAVVEELCRMMGGRPGDKEAMAHAQELRDRAIRLLID